MTKGQAALAKIVSDGRSQRSVARQLGITHSLVVRWVGGRQSPTTRYRAELERLHGIPLLSWDEPAEAEAAAPDSRAPAA